MINTPSIFHRVPICLSVERTPGQFSGSGLAYAQSRLYREPSGAECRSSTSPAHSPHKPHGDPTGTATSPLLGELARQFALPKATTRDGTREMMSPRCVWTCKAGRLLRFGLSCVLYFLLLGPRRTTHDFGKRWDYSQKSLTPPYNPRK